MREEISVSNINKRNFVIHIRQGCSFTKQELIFRLYKYQNNELFQKIISHLGDDEVVDCTIQYVSLSDGDLFIHYNDKQERIIMDCNDDIFDLSVDRKNHTYRYRETDKENEKIYEYLDHKELIQNILEFIDYLDLCTKKEDLIVKPNYLFKDMRLIKDDSVNVVIGDETLKLVLFNCYKVNPEWMNMKIVLNETNEIIGEIEFNLKKKDQKNFSYMGNVSYEIYPLFRNQGYCTKALELVKEYISKEAEEYNKLLYISTVIGNTASQAVAEKCGGILCYEGKVPENDRAKFLSKVDEVKIYKIANL